MSKKARLMTGREGNAAERGPYHKEVLPGQSNDITLGAFKKQAKKIVKDFILPDDVTKNLQARIDKATTISQVNWVLKEARNYI